jgi:polyhydroxyalkanoate synthase
MGNVEEDGRIGESAKIAENGKAGEDVEIVPAISEGDPFFGFRKEDLVATADALAKEATSHPTLLLEEQAELVREITKVLADRSEIKPSPKDKRFADVAWSENPFYRVFLGGYLAWTKTLEEFIDKSSFDELTKERARFFTEILTSALAPSNSLANPIVLKRVIDTGGLSLVHGFQNMISDLLVNNGMPSQVDKSAFEVGKNIGTTEGSVVFRNDVLELIQYKPQAEKVYELPLLFVPPQINKFYVFDLSPENSMFGYLLKNGIQVFVISWRNPTPEQRDWGMDTYVSAIVEAIAAVREICKVDKLNMGGACAGAMTLSALQGYYAAGEGENPLNCATHFVDVLDLGTDSILRVFMTKDILNTAKAASSLKGVLDGSDMGRTTWCGTTGSTTISWARIRPPSTSSTGTPTRPGCPPSSTASCWIISRRASSVKPEKWSCWGGRSISRKSRPMPTSSPE